MKNKNPWNLLRCIGIAPWYIPLNEQRFVFFEPPNGPGTPDGGVGDAGNESTESDEGGEADTVDDSADVAAAASGSVAGAAGRLEAVAAAVENVPAEIQRASISEQAAEKYLEAMEHRYPHQADVGDAVDRAVRRLPSAYTESSRRDVLMDLYDAVAEATAANEPEEEPAPAGVDDLADEPPVVPPGTESPAPRIGPEPAPAVSQVLPELAPIETAPRRPTITKERRGELTQDFILNQRPDGQKRTVPKGEVTTEGFKRVFGANLDLASTDTRMREGIAAAVTAKQESLNRILVAAKKPKIKVDGIFGPETFLAIRDNDPPTLAQLKGAPAAPTAGPAAAIAGAPAAGPTALATAPAEVAVPLPDLPTASRLTFQNGPEVKDASDYRSPDKYDEYTAEVGDILVLNTNIKDAGGNTVFREGLPVMVTRLGERKNDKNITLEVATAEGKVVSLKDGATLLSAADHLDNPNAGDIQKFIASKNVYRKTEWERARLDDANNMYRREVVFTGYAVDDNGQRVSAGTEGISQWTKETGYTVTAGDRVYRFKGVEAGGLPVKDKRFDDPKGQYAKLRPGTRVSIYHRGEKSGASIEITTQGDQVVLILGKTKDGYKIRTSWGGEGFITKAGLREDTRVARTSGQTVEQTMAAVEKKAAPAAAVVAAPAPAPPPAPVPVAAPAPAPPGAAPPPPTGTARPVVPSPAAPAA